MRPRLMPRTRQPRAVNALSERLTARNDSRSTHSRGRQGGFAEAPKRQPRDLQGDGATPTEQAPGQRAGQAGSASRRLHRRCSGPADYKRRRSEIKDDAKRARCRLAEFDAAPAQEPAALVVRSFADTRPTLSIEVRRDVAGALLTSVRVCQDKALEILPRWGEPVAITFTERGRAPCLPTTDDAGDAERASACFA